MIDMGDRTVEAARPYGQRRLIGWLKVGMKVGLSDAAWQRLTDEAMRLLSCRHCMSASGVAVLQPFWVGEAYEPGGVVLVGRNPAGKQLPESAEQLLARLRDEPSPAALLDWSRWRIRHMISMPWTQWQRAFAKVVAGCWTPEQLAWLNVVAYPTQGDARPSAKMLAHGRDQHLAPVLTEVLRPAAIIARYSDAARAAAAIPGPWQPQGVLTLTGRTASQAAIAAARRGLQTRGLCGHPTAGPLSSSPAASGVPSPVDVSLAGLNNGDAALRRSLLAALMEVSGFSPVDREDYTRVGDRPVWAFVDRRAGDLQVKFRVAAPDRTAEAICGRLVDSGVDAQVRAVRSRSGSIRLWVRLGGPADLAALRRELPALWRDYQQL